MLMQNFGVTNKEYYGMLWYFLEWSIERCARSGQKKLTKTYNTGFPNHSTLINYALGYLFSFSILFIYLFFSIFLLRLPIHVAHWELE